MIPFIDFQPTSDPRCVDAGGGLVSLVPAYTTRPPRRSHYPITPYAVHSDVYDIDKPRNGRAFDLEPRGPEFESCHVTDLVHLEKWFNFRFSQTRESDLAMVTAFSRSLRPVQGDHLANAVDRDRQQERLIERVQRRALRIVSMGGRREVPVLPTLKERRELAAVKLLKNMLEEDHPLHDLVPPARTRATGRTLRNATAITVPAARTQRLKNSFLHQAIRLYNKSVA
ncbi:hypothetical protein Bbelb_314100 [Branchiostoma belcheri]|nr:hypothetical protein Bbelb_314100 [Branchiostoma belcheri]